MVPSHTNGTGPIAAKRFVIAVSQWELTLACAEEAARTLEAAGCQVVRFAADGVGGREMEARIAAGEFDGVLETTLTELADELLHGTMSAGAARLEAAAGRGIPTVVVPGGLDAARFAADAVPLQYRRRRLQNTADGHTLMRLDPGDSARVGRLLAEKLNRFTGQVALCLPLGGFSALDAPGQPFYATDANMTLLGNLTTHLRRDIPLYEGNVNINAPAFARMTAEKLLERL